MLDPTGAAITGATILVSETTTGHLSTGKTDSSGHYALSPLAAGRYKVRITTAGFRGFEETNAQLVGDQPLHVDAKLLVGSTSSTVQVLADATMLYTALEASAGTRTTSPLQPIPWSITANFGRIRSSAKSSR